MKPVLILQHQLPERPAYLTTWLDKNNIAYKTFNAGAGEDFPSSMEPYAALALLGGGMSANDPLISNRQAEILVLQAVRLDRPVIGHCLGGQLMTRAMGGTVGASIKPEIGWQPVDYENHLLRLHWFGFDPTPMVMHWHYEAFSIPSGAVRLASSAACENQAWAMGKCLAMQFHIEMDDAKAREWAADQDPKWDQARADYDTVQDSAAILAAIQPNLARHQATASHVYNTWLHTTEWARALEDDK